MARSLRLFVGAFPPPEAAHAVHRAARMALAGADVRVVTAEEIHLTLRFLGATEETAVPDLRKALEESLRRQPSARLRIRGAGTFPETGRAHVLWVGISGSLSALAAAVGESEVRTPHLTVARPSRGERVEVPQAFRDLAIDLSWTLDEVRLVESRPREHGPDRFPILASFRLSPDRV